MADHVFNPFFSVELFDETYPLNPKELDNFNAEFQKMMALYEQGLELVITDIMDGKRLLEKQNGYTMIRSLSTRLKSIRSIFNKLSFLGFPLTIASMKTNLFDIAGIRIICSYIDDIYEMASFLKSCPTLEVIQIKDYIKTPKPTGYRSLHVIVMVSLPDQNIHVPCEIQLRTTAMDSWASLEHQMRYKKNHAMTSTMHKELQECASLLNESDLRMQSIHRQLAMMNEEETENE